MGIAHTDDAGNAADRDRMVDRQIKARGIRDERVLEACRRVPRHLFVGERFQGEAYADHPIQIGHGQTISQPYIVAAMVEALRLEPSSRVLEIGTGCGYQTAILAELVPSVHTVEIIPELAEEARDRLFGLGYADVDFKTGDGAEGWAEAGPFDCIVVSAAPHHVPPALLDQLSPGGRCVIPEGDLSQELNRYLRTEDGWEVESLMAVRFVPLV